MTTLNVTLEQAKQLRGMVESDIKAMHNHIASAIEEHDRKLGTGQKVYMRSPVKMVADLRALQDLFANVNGTIMREEGLL